MVRPETPRGSQRGGLNTFPRPAIGSWRCESAVGAGATGLEPAIVTPRIEILVEYGFISRERDGLQHRYHLTDDSPLRVFDALSTDIADQLQRLASILGHERDQPPSPKGSYAAS